jgi:hypothetical protein
VDSRWSCGASCVVFGKVSTKSSSPIEVSAKPAHTADNSPYPAPIVPQPISELIGRDEELGAIVKLIAEHRLVTIVGVGGIGKTRLALAAARELLPHFNDGVWFAELSTLARHW